MLAELRSIRWLALGYFFVLEVLLVLAVLSGRTSRRTSTRCAAWRRCRC